MRKPLIIGSLAAVIATSFAFAPGKPRYDNLKVLPKDTDKHQMDSIMHHFSSSLGVKCNFCHVVKEVDGKRNIDFASDDNQHKQIARQMYKMTAKINKKYFDEKDENHKDLSGMPTVTCYSCHHGKEQPENQAAAPNSR